MVPCECEYCQSVFFYKKRFATRVMRHGTNKGRFCSRSCCDRSLERGSVVTCSQCGSPTKKRSRDIARSKSGRLFCSQSCSATYSNTHKTTSIRRSKLEQLIEQNLKDRFPGLECLFNDKTTIGSELDVYLPSLKLAFELNGIFHYEPIFGDDKLQKIQANDKNKFQRCQEHGISLCIIDTSQHSYVTQKTSQKYIDIVLEIIERHKSWLLEPRTSRL